MPNKSTWVSPTAVALFPTSTGNMWGCWGTGRHRTHTVPLGTTEQTPPEQGDAASSRHYFPSMPLPDPALPPYILLAA